MIPLLTDQERYQYLVKHWDKELAIEHGVCLISRIDYSAIKFELSIEFIDPEKHKPNVVIVFSRVSLFVDVVFDPEVREEGFDFEGSEGMEDPLDFIESKKGDVVEYFIHTQYRELWFQTKEAPSISNLEGI